MIFSSFSPPPLIDQKMVIFKFLVLPRGINITLKAKNSSQGYAQGLGLYGNGNIISKRALSRFRPHTIGFHYSARTKTGISRRQID